MQRSGKRLTRHEMLEEGEATTGVVATNHEPVANSLKRTHDFSLAQAQNTGPGRQFCIVSHMETISLSFKSTLRDCTLRSWAFLVQHSDCPEKPGTIASAMYEYASYCPVAATTSVVGDYWTPLIVRELLYGTVRFNQLARNLPSISRSLLSDRLRKLDRDGVVECERRGSNVTSYNVTPAGRGLQAVIDAMNEWGTRWGHRDASPQALDPMLTICMMKDRMRVEELPDSRVVVEVGFQGRRGRPGVARL